MIRAQNKTAFFAATATALLIIAGIGIDSSIAASSLSIAEPVTFAATSRGAAPLLRIQGHACAIDNTGDVVIDARVSTAAAISFQRMARVHGGF